MMSRLNKQSSLRPLLDCLHVHHHMCIRLPFNDFITSIYCLEIFAYFPKIYNMLKIEVLKYSERLHPLPGNWSKLHSTLQYGRKKLLFRSANQLIWSQHVNHATDSMQCRLQLMKMLSKDKKSKIKPNKIALLDKTIDQNSHWNCNQVKKKKITIDSGNRTSHV